MNMQQNYSFQNNEENMNHKTLKKLQNQKNSQIELGNNNINATAINLNMLNNLNYNESNNKFMKNHPNNIINNNLSLSSQGQKNTIPNFNQSDNINLMAGHNQQIPPLINMNFSSLGNRYYVPQNMKNVHMNNNYMNNNHLNNPNNINNKDYNNSGFNHPNMGNNKKYQKQYNYNTYQHQGSNHLNNNMNNNHIYNNTKNHKNNMNNSEINNSNLNNNYNQNNSSGKNYNLKSSKESHSNINLNNNNNNNNQKPKKYLLSLKLKLGNNKTEIINIKNIEDCQGVLKEIKEKHNLNQNVMKIINNKIFQAIDITKKIYDFSVNKYTYRNLAEIKNNLIFPKRPNNEKIIKKNKSFKEIKNCHKEEMTLSKNDMKEIESLNISF